MEEIRKNRELTDIEHAVETAINTIPEDFQIKPFLKAHRSEVCGMLLTEYNEAQRADAAEAERVKYRERFGNLI